MLHGCYTAVPRPSVLIRNPAAVHTCCPTSLSLGWNCAEAVNFALKSWLPTGRRARPCTCNGQQTPFIDVPLLVRRLRHAEPEATQEWWCFVCACGRHQGVSQAPTLTCVPLRNGTYPGTCPVPCTLPPLSAPPRKALSCPSHQEDPDAIPSHTVTCNYLPMHAITHRSILFRTAAYIIYHRRTRRPIIPPASSSSVRDARIGVTSPVTLSTRPPRRRVESCRRKCSAWDAATRGATRGTPMKTGASRACALPP